MKIGNDHGKITAKEKKRLGNIPRRWRFDGTKLYMLFRDGNCSYLVIEKACVYEDTDDTHVGISEDGSRYLLKNDRMSESLAA